jgi:hypothetical protein
MYIAAVILISRTCSIYQNYGFGIIINSSYETQNTRNAIFKKGKQLTFN